MGSSEKHDLAARAAEIEITGEVSNLLAELDEFKGAWRVLGNSAPERLESLRRVATIESVGSSTRIEGAKLSDAEVERLLERIEVQSFATRDEQEVAGYAEVMNTVFESAQAIELSENNIRQLHRDLLKHSEKDARHRGSYKGLPNHVEAFDADGASLGVVFETATPFDTPVQMEALTAWAKSVENDETLHPLLAIAVFTIELLAIHPFQDGNGRLSRVLTTLQLIRAGYSYAPYSSLESVIEESKEDYYLALRRTQGTLQSSKPNWGPWIAYFLRILKRQKDRLDVKLSALQAVPNDLPKLSTVILTLARTGSQISMADAVKATGASRDTLRHHFNALVRAGHLTRRGAGRGTWYTLD